MANGILSDIQATQSPGGAQGPIVRPSSSVVPKPQAPSLKPSSVLIGLGSNLGDRARFLRRAVERLSASEGVEWKLLSTVRETAPEGRPADGDLGGPYLNAAAEVSTRLPAEDFLALCLAIEADLGRERPRPNAPRSIDLD